MKNKDPLCFISYCHADIERVLVEYIIFTIRQSMKSNITILYDSDLAPGANLSKFMEKTLDVDVAILLLTPLYKQKVDKRDGGVYKEYTQISNRYWQEQENKCDSEIAFPSHDFSLVPVIISGNVSDSVPETIRDLYCVNLSGFTVSYDKEGNYVVTDFIKTKYNKEIQRIIDCLVATASLKSKAFEVEREKLYDTLFVNTKTNEQILQRCPDFFKSVFVSNAAFRNIQAERSYFLIGRKGSGKSTLATAIKITEKDRYNGVVAIRADDINLNISYTTIRASIQADIQSILPDFSFYTYVWKGFLCLCIIELLEQLDKTDNITNIQKKHMTAIKHFIDLFRRNHTSGDLKPVFFTYSVQKLQDYFEKCIRQARESQFWADLSIAFNERESLLYLLGEDVIGALTDIVSNCKKRVLLTLDDFDTIFDTFRRKAITNEDAQLRATFEMEWLRSLLLLILDLKDSRLSKHPLFRTLDFCVTIPKDRYLEIERTERDAYRYSPRTSSIDWSGIELCEVLFKRLQKIGGYEDSIPGKIHEKLRYILKIEYPSLPEEIKFNFDDQEIRIPLFCYILRHTFWRPRDILTYYTDILAAATSVQRCDYTLTDAVIRRIVSETTYKIIKTEFLDEYKTSISNIRQIVNCFMKKSQVLTYDDIQNCLKDMPIILNISTQPITTFQDKVDFLYDIGFLGVIVSKEIRESLNLGTDEAFYFNEGRTPIRTACKCDFRDVKFAIHPIFSENLQLIHRNNTFLHQYTWQYLYDNHIIKTSTFI